MKTLRFTNEDTANFCSSFSYLLHAGISGADALQIMAEDETRPEYAGVLKEMAEKADGGAQLSEITAERPEFPATVGRMLAVGEKTGRLEEALEALTASCERRASTEKQLKSALLYPSILLLIMMAVVAVLLIYVLPIFNNVYSQLGGSLTGVAGGLLSFGEFLGKWTAVLIVIFIFAALFLTFFSLIPSFRDEVIDKWQNRRGEKGLAGKLNAATFAQALALAMSSGMNIEDAVEGASELMRKSPETQAKIDKCMEALRDGAGTADAIRESGLIPPAQCRILEAGIKGGSGEQAMEKIAERLTEESEAAIEESLGRVEPAMVIITSVLVGLILLSVMFPLVNIMSAIG